MTQQPSEVSQQITEKLTFKTKIYFNDLNRAAVNVVSVVAPQMSPARILQFVTDDRMVCYPTENIFRWETEQLREVVVPKIVV